MNSPMCGRLKCDSSDRLASAKIAALIGRGTESTPSRLKLVVPEYLKIERA